MSNKYSLVEESRKGLTSFNIHEEGKSRESFGGTYGRSDTANRVTEYTGRRLRLFLLSYLVGQTTKEELMTEAKDFCAVVKTILDRNVSFLRADAAAAAAKGVKTAPVTYDSRNLSNEIQRLEGPFSLYGLIEKCRCQRFNIGTNVDDISVELITMQDYTVKLEASINAYHELEGRIMDEVRSTEEHPVFLDGMRVCATIRGRFDDTNLFTLLQARLALMKGEPLKSLSKKTLTIRPVETA